MRSGKLPNFNGFLCLHYNVYLVLMDATITTNNLLQYELACSQCSWTCTSATLIYSCLVHCQSTQYLRLSIGDSSGNRLTKFHQPFKAPMFGNKA